MRSGKFMMVADFCTENAAAELFRPSPAATIEATSLLVVDPAALKAAAKFIP